MHTGSESHKHFFIFRKEKTPESQRLPALALYRKMNGKEGCDYFTLCLRSPHPPHLLHKGEKENLEKKILPACGSIYLSGQKEKGYY